MSRHAKTPGGTLLVMMQMPPAGKKRDLFSAAAQQSFDNARTKMTDLNSAIVQQQQTRTPAPVQNTPEQLEIERDPKNRLTKSQSSFLSDWVEDHVYGLVGMTLEEVVCEFNKDVAPTSGRFPNGGALGITTSNLYYVLRQNGLGVSNYKVVATDPELFRRLTSPAPVEPVDLPPGVVAVTLYRGADGRLYETSQEAAEASRVDELGQFIYESQDGHDESSAKDLARKLLARYNISEK